MARAEWIAQLNKFQDAEAQKSREQVLTSFIPYFILWTAMFLLLRKGYPYWTALILSPIAGLLLVKIFIILHDCSHKSYMGRSEKGCFILGHICGILTFTSFSAFRRSHIIHHATVANLEKRGVGDIWTLTVDEYHSSTVWKRAVYRFFRNPVFLFLIAPPLFFLLVNRIPKSVDRSREVLSIIFTDIVIAAVVAVAFYTIGFKMYAAVQLPVIYLASVFGVWIFYAHHQFENVYWAHDRDLDRVKAAINGSSFYKFPALLEWFTGHIGYHQLHHLSPGIPNYNLGKCFDSTPQLHMLKPRTFQEGFKSMFLALWDETTGKLMGFSSMKKA